MHTNSLEMRVVLLALLTFQDWISHSLMLITDNSSLVGNQQTEEKGFSLFVLANTGDLYMGRTMTIGGHYQVLPREDEHSDRSTNLLR